MTVKLSRRSLLQGVSLAAQQLEVSTATATRQMTTLRTLLHDPLFLRGHDGLVPTARMSERVPKLKVLQEGLIDVVRRPVKFDPAEIKSTIRVAGVDNAIFAFLMPCLKDLYGVATGLHLSCVPLTENFPKLLASGRIDIAFYAPPLLFVRNARLPAAPFNLVLPGRQRPLAQSETAAHRIWKNVCGT